MIENPVRDNDIILEVKDLTKEFKSVGKRETIHAVNSVSFQLKRGETIGLIGESGSGKTTVGRCVLRLIEPTSGSINYKGINLVGLTRKKLRKLRPDMQMVFQDPSNSLNPRLNVRQTLEDTLKIKEKLLNEKFDIENLMLETLGQVGMETDYLQKYSSEMSGGYQQRVGIARAICGNPTMVILDEPTSALDLPVCAEILDLLKTLQERLGISYIYISHDLTTVRFICHKVAVMYLGEFVEFGSVEQVFMNPLHPYSLALMSSVMAPDPKSKGSVVILEGEIPSPINLPKGCFFYARCPHAKAECAEIHPSLTDTGDGHYVRCVK